FISRTHARIHVEGAAYKITDLGSTNGTKVNGAPLAPNVSRVLHNGDLVELGRVILQFRLL
ncbi:MAG: FHA domain-containing protein, partial [Caldilineaceae bacterium]|nr:FHA domain-containing protein [Caldilineaceae bacterium]